MIIYGLNPVLEAIRAHPRRIHYVAIARDRQPRLQKLMAEAKQQQIAVRLLPLDQIDRAAGGGVHNGVIADVSEGSYANFHDVLALSSTRLVLVLDGVQDPQNLGAILRVADVFSVNLVVIPEHDSVGLTSSAVKASAGASEWVSVAQVTNLARTIEDLKKAEFWVYGAEAGGDPLGDVDLRGKVALVLGSEGKGIRRNVLEHCDRRIAIPMSGHVNSLNVAGAAAVICYEVRRQGDR
ncbi:MAG: 23S rRNA (guanosine(2251)-2'-O)-methyltransferase RlmB [Acidobacteriota bacterium]